MDNAPRHQLSETKHPVLRSIGRALPPNYYDQKTLSSALWSEWSGKVEDYIRLGLWVVSVNW